MINNIMISCLIVNLVLLLFSEFKIFNIYV